MLANRWWPKLLIFICQCLEVPALRLSHGYLWQDVWDCLGSWMTQNVKIIHRTYSTCLTTNNRLLIFAKITDESSIFPWLLYCEQNNYPNNLSNTDCCTFPAGLDEKWSFFHANASDSIGHCQRSIHSVTKFPSCSQTSRVHHSMHCFRQSCFVRNSIVILVTSIGQRITNIPCNPWQWASTV